MRSDAAILFSMKKLLITDRNSDSSRQSLIKIKKNIVLDKSAKLTVTEIMPWIRIDLTYDEKAHDTRTLITQFRQHGFVAAEV
jgi:hypothetical protein